MTRKSIIEKVMIVLATIICIGSITATVIFAAGTNEKAATPDEAVVTTTVSTTATTVPVETTITATEASTTPTETQIVYEEYEEESNSYSYDIPEGDYAVATAVWEYLNELGYNNYVCAGIIGNMMIETSGGTLDLNPYIYSYDGCYYGLCQWSSYYSPGVQGADINGQLRYLTNGLAETMNNWGFCYYDSFDYSAFCGLTDERAAARAFAKCYERCAQNEYNYSVREDAATLAYSYFVN